MKELVKLITDDKQNLQRWFGAEICLFILFLLALSHFLRFSLNPEYANEIIYISDHRKKGMCLSFYVVPYVMLYDKQHSNTQLRVYAV